MGHAPQPTPLPWEVLLFDRSKLIDCPNSNQFWLTAGPFRSWYFVPLPNWSLFLKDKSPVGITVHENTLSEIAPPLVWLFKVFLSPPETQRLSGSCLVFPTCFPGGALDSWEPKVSCRCEVFTSKGLLIQRRKFLYCSLQGFSIIAFPL